MVELNRSARLQTGERRGKQQHVDEPAGAPARVPGLTLIMSCDTMTAQSEKGRGHAASSPSTFLYTCGGSCA